MATRLSDLRRRYVDLGRPMPAALEAELRADPRPGARALLSAIERRRRLRRSEGQRLRHLLRFEQELWERGVRLIAGIDEVGMSPLAGPVAAGAVVLKVGWRAPGINDSKQLTPAIRAQLAGIIRSEAVACAVGFAEPEEIDRLNIYWASLLAMRRAVEALGIVPEHLLIDARRLAEVPIQQSRIVKGDERSLSIAAASIVAKDERDARMTAYEREFPGYGFARHKGYPVREHRSALERLGACPIHRRSFAPVRRALGLDPPA
ncbi:MAG TPA: ribonuclease HII [Polyangiaceae bacterium]